MMNNEQGHDDHSLQQRPQLRSPERLYSPDSSRRIPTTKENIGREQDAQRPAALAIRAVGHGPRTTEGPLSPVRMNNTFAIPEASTAQVETWSSDNDRSRTPSRDLSALQIAEANTMKDADAASAPGKTWVASESSVADQSTSPHAPWTEHRSTSPMIVMPTGEDALSREYLNTDPGNRNEEGQTQDMVSGLQYHHQRQASENSTNSSKNQHTPPRSQQSSTNARNQLHASSSRPNSSYSAALDIGRLGGNGSPGLSPNTQARTPSAQGRRSPDTRPLSYVDLLSLPYSQQAPPNTNFNRNHLQTAVGSNASLLSSKQTLEMYRANVKKTNDPAIQYSFAIFMLEAAQDVRASGAEAGAASPGDLVLEARQILQRLADKSYPFAQYYLADGYASGVFNKGKEDNDKAFTLFVAASKHGHAEAGYRAALCYEFGWGTRKDPLKAVQFYRQSASKNHPGAMVRLGRACMAGDLGLGNRYREGVKWLKRAAESADFQYNTAPYELGRLHETGYGDDIFRDETYAAQLFTQSADLGHPEASFRLGDAYEHGKLNCPRDPALSVHFYNGAASRGHPQAMMALCAWYMVGAEPVLDKDENEAYEWAKKAAECGLPKAEYAVGYFTEMGIGCRRDPLEANVWYVKAADQGDERAKHRLAAIHSAASGGSVTPAPTTTSKSKKGHGFSDDKDKTKTKKWGIF